MNKILKCLVSILLAISMILGTAVTVFAKEREVYLSELRLVYADNYYDAMQVLANSTFQNYQFLNVNLNAGSGKIGVWLAYKTTTNIYDAITDMRVMQMGGGYSEGNYSALIKREKDAFLEMGETYLEAVEYFAEAVEAGSFLAESAYRQLNLYSGLDLYEDEPLGDLFAENVLTSYDLATLFTQGNSYVLKNIRTLLAMGVSYNEDGTSYLGKVGVSAEKMTARPDVFDGMDYDSIAESIAPTVIAFGAMLEELSAYEDELDYTDEDFTEFEIRYSEYKAIAEMLRATPYLNGQSLYDFCLGYTVTYRDYSSLYPLVDALNEGQEALVKISCFRDVVRYSVTDLPEDLIDEEIAKLEEIYGDDPVDVYFGVDRDLYEGTFALTDNAYRTDSYSDSSSLSEALLGDGAWMMQSADISSGVIDVGLSLWTIEDASGAIATAEKAESIALQVSRYTAMVEQAINAVGGQSVNVGPFIDNVFEEYTVFDLTYDLIYNYDKKLADPDWTYERIYDCLKHEILAGGMFRSDEGKALMELISSKVEQAESAVVKKAPTVSKSVLGLGMDFTTLFYFLDAAYLASYAISLGLKVYDHYHPTYEDIPTIMVDAVETASGDAYVKYDVVREVTKQMDGSYSAGDLNAFEGRRWNALYYTKDAKAGNPLLVDFLLSNINNRASEGYMEVRRFGEVVCYDLNKYNFTPSHNIFLSVRYSENQKPDGIVLPDIVGSVFANGLVFVSGGIGLIFSIGGMVGMQAILKKKKQGSDGETEND